MSDEIRTRPATDAYRAGWDRVFGSPTEAGMKIYFAHPMSMYGTQFEALCVSALEDRYGKGSVVNPNAPEHKAAYQARKAATGEGMSYFLDTVLPGCDAVAFVACRDGMITSGVAMEVEWFRERGLPVLELGLSLVMHFGADYTMRTLSREESKARVRNDDGTTMPY